MPDWMRILYITVLKFGVPCNQLMFHRDFDGIKIAWCLGIVLSRSSNVQQFLDLLQEKDEKDIDFFN